MPLAPTLAKPVRSTTPLPVPAAPLVSPPPVQPPPAGQSREELEACVEEAVERLLQLQSES